MPAILPAVAAKSCLADAPARYNGREDIAMYRFTIRELLMLVMIVVWRWDSGLRSFSTLRCGMS